MLILGGGFAGVYAAKAIRKAVRDPSFRVGILSDENHMVFQPMLPEVVGGSLAPRHVVNPIRRISKGVECYRGKVKELHLKEKRVRISAGRHTGDVEFRCDQLVLALGAVVDTSRIPGMAEHAYLLRNVGDAMKLRARIISRMEEANLEVDKARRQKLLRFLVVGGGYSGVETAGQILDLIKSICRYYTQIDSDDFSVSLVHSRDHVLPTLHEKLGIYTGEVLKENGMTLHMGHRVRSVTAGLVTLDSGEELEANTVVCTVGNAPHPLISGVCREEGITDERGRIVVDPTLQVPGQEGLWAAGDCASVPMKGGGFCPPNAQFAYRQGVELGKNIGRIRKGEPTQSFDFTGLGELAVIGHRKAVAEIMGRNFNGFLAWWMWRTIYLSKLPGIERRLRVTLEWTIELFFPRDINLLTPQYTSPLREMYLTAGDVLFRGGEPAYSFYMVKSGSVDILDDNGDLIKRLGPGQHFGERALLADRVWRFTAQAREDSHLVSLGAQVFDTLMYASGDLAGLLKGTATAYETGEGVREISSNIPEERRSLKAADLMNRSLCTLQEHMPVTEALTLLQRERHTLYPVVDGEGCLCGAIRRGGFYEWIRSHKVQPGETIDRAPVAPILTVPPDLPVPDLMNRLIREGRTRALVVEEGKLVGVVTVMDLLGGSEDVA